MNNPFQKNPGCNYFDKPKLDPKVRDKFKKAKDLEEIIRSSEKPAEVIAYIMEGNNFSTVDEANIFLNQIQDKWNTTPRIELFEHSPKEVATLLYGIPYNTNNCINQINLSNYVDEIEKSYFYKKWVRLLSYIESNRVGCTKLGNLNRKAVNDLKTILGLPEIMADHPGWIRNEDDWGELSTLRTCAYFAGLIRKHKDTWKVGRLCKALLKTNNQSSLYIMLFDSWFNRLDWSSTYNRHILEEIDYQSHRYFILSAILRTVHYDVSLSDFFSNLRDYLRIEAPKSNSDMNEELIESDLRFMFYYPLFSYLEKMYMIKLVYKKDSNLRFDVPDKFCITKLGKHVIEALLSPSKVQ